MNTFSRIEKILTSPKLFWKIYKKEAESSKKIFFSFVIPLSLIPALLYTISWVLLGPSLDSKDYPIRMVIIGFLIVLFFQLFNIFIKVCVFGIIAKSFTKESKFDDAFKLIANSHVPYWIGLTLFFLVSPFVGQSVYSYYSLLLLIVLICFIYQVIILFYGVPIMTGILANRGWYIFISFLIVGLINFLLYNLLIRNNNSYFTS